MIIVSFAFHNSSKKNQYVFFSEIAYSNEIFSEESKKSIDSVNNFTLVTGIANANPLVDFLKKKDLQFEHLNYKDHHEFSQQDILELDKQALIITTEKDFMRLKQYKSLKDKLFYLPIKVVINDEAAFNKLIKDFVET